MIRWSVGGISALLCGVWSCLAMAASGAGITYHGRLLKADGTPVTSSSVQFQIQIRTPGSENCLMYQETQTKDLSATLGVFSITINDGTATTPNTEPFTLSELFKNSGSFSFGAGKCSGGSTYNPSPTDGRKLAVSFNDGSGWETLPAQSINFVPLALESESVGGKTPSSFLRVESSAESSNTTELTATDLTNFWDLLNGTSSQYMKSSSSNGANLPPLSSAPTAPSAGTIWYDSSNNKIKYFDGTTTQTVGTSGGSVTGITVGTGLVDGSGNTGTTITTSGTIKLPAVGTADTYYKVTTDAEGRVTTGSTSLAESDLPTITTAGKVSGGAITSGTIGGTTAINTSGDLKTSGNVSSTNLSATTASLQTLRLFESTNTHKVTMTVPTSLAADYSLILPLDDGTSGQVLSTDGSGNLSWVSPATGSVTSVTASAPLSVDATTASAPALSITQASASVDGYLSSTDWTTFNNKLSAVGNTASLADGKVWIGDGGGKAQEKSVSGDVGLTNAGVASVNKIKGYGLDFSTAPTSGNFLKYNSSNWVAASITESDVSGLTTDLGNKIDVSNMPANCTSGQTLTFSSPTGTWDCSDITVSGSNFTSQTANTVFAAPDGSAGAPSFRALTVDDLPSGIASQWSDGTGGAIYYNDGNVGIGTSTPGSLLTVNGRLEVDGGLLLNQGSGATDNLIYTGSSSTGAVDASMGFFAAGLGSGSANDGPYFLARGNDFSGATKQRGNIYLTAGIPTSADPAEGSINFWTGYEQSRMMIANNGNIGIGMTPFGKLSIADDGYDGTTDIMTSSYLPGVSILSGSDYVGLTSLDRDGDMTTTTDDKDGMLYWGDNTDDSFRFASVTSNQATTRMIITGTGDVGVGTTAPSEKLEVNGNIKATNFIGDGSQLTGITASGVSSGTGTASAPSMTFSSDPDTGFYSSGTNEIGVSAGGTNIFNLSSLGLTSPTSGGGVVTTAAGTSSAPTFSFSGDTDTGWYHPAANTLAAATGGTERVRIDASGNVGIGTSSPWAKFEVVDSNADVQARVINRSSTVNHYPTISVLNYTDTAGDGYPVFQLTNSGGNDGATAPIVNDNSLGKIQFSGGTDNNWGTATGAVIEAKASEDFSATNSGTYLTFATTKTGSTGVSERLRIDPDGNVGIGTTSPQGQLHIVENKASGIFIQGVSGVNSGNADFMLSSASANGQWDFAATDADGSLSIWDALNSKGPFTIEANTPSNTLYLKSSGNIGIGTASPAAHLTVVTAAGTSTTGIDGGAIELQRDETTFPTVGGFIDFKKDSADDYRARIEYDENQGLSFLTTDTGSGGTTRFFISEKGNVGVGTTSPRAALDVDGAIVGTTTTNAAAVTQINFLSGNVQVSSNNTNNATIDLCGLQDGSAYTLVMKAQPDGSVPVFSAYSDADCTSSLTLDSGGVTMTVSSATTLFTFVRAGSVVYATVATGFTH